MTRLAAGVAAALLLILALILHTSWQPAGKARVSVRNGSVRVLRGRVGFYPRYLGSACLVDRGAAFDLLFHGKCAAADPHRNDRLRSPGA